MGREKRINQPGFIYHVINRGNNRQAVFFDEEDFLKYLGLLYRFKKKYEFKLFAYCLMTNHVHLLIKVGTKGTISQIMQSLTVAHTRHYHIKYQRCGHVWQGRFTSPIISDDAHLLTVMRYIEQNPLRAKMVKDLAAYRWSSYRLNSREQRSKLIDRGDNDVYMGLGDTDTEQIKTYQDLMRESVPEMELTAIRSSVKTGIGYMSEKFRQQIAGILPQKRKRGRPRINGVNSPQTQTMTPEKDRN